MTLIYCQDVSNSTIFKPLTETVAVSQLTNITLFYGKSRGAGGNTVKSLGLSATYHLPNILGVCKSFKLIL